MRCTFALACVAGLAACRGIPPEEIPLEPPSVVIAPVTLVAEEVRYAPGATVTFRIANFTQDSLGYNACTRSVERHEGGNNWSVHPEPARVCTLELAILEPRMTQTATTDLPPRLRGGTYRLTLLFSRQGPSGTGTRLAIAASTQPFVVR